MNINNFTVTLTSVPVALASTNVWVKYIMVQADKDNSAFMTTGGSLINSTTVGTTLLAREYKALASDKDDLNLKLFYVAGTAGDKARIETISGG